MTFHCTVVIDIEVVMNATGCTRNLTDSAKKGNRKEVYQDTIKRNQHRSLYSTISYEWVCLSINPKNIPLLDH
jgi:hypothetical protein